MKLKTLIILCCGILLIGCSSKNHQSNLINAQVTRVVSGQTVEVLLAPTSTKAKVRIIGIDAPDLYQSPWGAVAKGKLAELVTGLPVQLELEDSDLNSLMTRDSFNRIHAHLWQDKTLISQKLVKAGCVLANIEYPHLYSKLLINAQEYARLLGYGIWNSQQPLRYTPSQFRSNKHT